ncbi:hypothetical protein F0562_021853 [Nyssa sinensis]|uniref:CCT domain-containing protein n=1 Tax=Nyssa sinensis TaxID=561372 RepID=A0A5J5BP99_9ASTE|nr:hypothetical protein F0562_021853 [Nyssa sinensis]
MYGHNTTINNTFISDAPAHFFGHFPSLLPDVTAPPSAQVILPPPPPLVIPGNEFDSMWALKSEVGYTSSGCSSYGSSSSLASYSSTQGSSLIQRSVSSHSLIQKNGFCGQLVSSPTEFVDSETSPVRRVFSTGDLQRINMVQQYHRSESPLSNESIIESMNKACRYSPEEKKERIERYRSKRNQRNFNKKIKYACRKTLADSRPRIRGRFARNDEIEKSCPNQWSQVSGEEEEEDDDNWINFLETFSCKFNSLIPWKSSSIYFECFSTGVFFNFRPLVSNHDVAFSKPLSFKSAYVNMADCMTIWSFTTRSKRVTFLDSSHIMFTASS